MPIYRMYLAIVLSRLGSYRVDQSFLMEGTSDLFLSSSCSRASPGIVSIHTLELEREIDVCRFWMFMIFLCSATGSRATQRKAAFTGSAGLYNLRSGTGKRFYLPTTINR